MDRRRALLACSIGFVALYAVAILVQGTPPKPNDTGDAVVAWMTQHHNAVRAASWFATMATPLFLMFAVYLREVLGGVAGRALMVGVTATAALTVTQSWITLGLARRPQSLDPAIARTLLDVAAYWGPSLIAFTVLTLGAIAWSSLRDGKLPRWLGILAAIALVEQLVESVTLFGTSGFIAPGGPMNALLGAGLTLIVWMLAGILGSRQTEQTAP